MKSKSISRAVKPVSKVKISSALKPSLGKAFDFSLTMLTIFLSLLLVGQSWKRVSGGYLW